MKIVFMGTPEFAVDALQVCIDHHEVVGVFTQPDRPKGRGKKLAAPPVKEKALEYDLPVFQPEKLKTEESVELLKKLNPDCIVVVAYGQLLSKEILDLPKHGCINVHASLLPKFRGASPIQWAIVKGEKETGVTTMFMDVGLDTGDMILKSHIDIHDQMTAGELHDLLKVSGAETLKSTLEQLDQGTAPRVKQSDSESSYAPLLNKTMGIIDWTKTAREIDCLVRGFNPWPVATSEYQGEKFKIFKTEVTETASNKPAGTVLSITDRGMQVATGDFVINIIEIQFPSSKRMTVGQYILGNSLETGVILG